MLNFVAITVDVLGGRDNLSTEVGFPRVVARLFSPLTDMARHELRELSPDSDFFLR